MDRKRNDARMRAAGLLKRFYEDLTSRLATGTAELSRKVELRLSQESAATEPEGNVPPGALQAPMQQQPVQQQQAKTKSDDK